jgi:TonB family protein
MMDKLFTISLSALLFLALGPFSTSAQTDDVPAEIQKYVDGRGGKKKFPTEINKLVMGDLNRDGKDDAVVQYIIQEGYPGNYYSSHIAVFLNRRGKFVYTTQMSAGTKLVGGLVPVFIRSGTIALDKYGENSDQVVGAVFYKLVGAKLVKTKMPAVMEMRLDRITKLGNADSDKVAIVENDDIPTTSRPNSPGEVVNGKATSLPKPAYPPAARAVKASGSVSVRVLIDENGNVISATAISGHPLLRAAAESAARGAKFAPTLLHGQPVKVSGVVVYNFVP